MYLREVKKRERKNIRVDRWGMGNERRCRGSGSVYEVCWGRLRVYTDVEECWGGKGEGRVLTAKGERIWKGVWGRRRE